MIARGKFSEGEPGAARQASRMLDESHIERRSGEKPGTEHGERCKDHVASSGELVSRPLVLAAKRLRHHL
jgi:hypothetical protein